VIALGVESVGAGIATALAPSVAKKVPCEWALQFLVLPGGSLAGGRSLPCIRPS
jgi:hypothetical protein